MRRDLWTETALPLQPILFDLRYLFRPPWDTRISPPELLTYIGSHTPGAALDLGCGTGTNVITLANSGWHATGVDFSQLAIHRARRRIAQANLPARVLAADVSRPLPLLDSFDLVLDLGCFHMLRQKQGYLRNLEMLLKVGGHWLMYGFCDTSAAARAVGLGPGDIKAVLSRPLRLLEWRDGFDRGRPSAWFLFEKTLVEEPPLSRLGHRAD